MNKNLFFLITFTMFFYQVIAQTELVKWSFITGQFADTLPTVSTPLNATMAIRSVGTSAITITNGQVSGDYAATATGWDNGADTKYWCVFFKTTGFNNIKISSKQRAGGTNGGPVDFKIQYKIGEFGLWANVASGNVTLANNWTVGAVSGLSMPAECENQSELIYVRWLMTTNNDINGGILTAVGISKIDEIVISGSAVSSVDQYESANKISVYPNPSNGNFIIQLPDELNEIIIYNISGKIIYKRQYAGVQEIVDLKNVEAGIYFLYIRNEESIICEKLIVQ